MCFMPVELSARPLSHLRPPLGQGTKNLKEGFPLTQRKAIACGHLDEQEIAKEKDWILGIDITAP